MSTTPPTEDELVSMSGVPPLTVMFSATCATFRSKLMSSVCETLTTIPVFDTVVNPGSAATTS